jgi:polar amino acid transport system permease protein
MVSSVTEQLTQALPLLAVGAGQTLAISLLAILFATLGGVAYGVLAQQGGRLVRGLLRCYLELFRVVPVLVWLYLFFFGLPIFFGLDIPAFWCAVLVLAPWGASEVGEVVRGGLKSLRRPGWRSGSRPGSSIAMCCCPRRCSG